MARSPSWSWRGEAAKKSRHSALRAGDAQKRGVVLQRSAEWRAESNVMADAVCCRPRRCRLGLSTSFEPVPMDASADAIWEGVKNRYWHLPVYFVPTCIMAWAAEEGAGAAAEQGPVEQQGAGGAESGSAEAQQEE